MLSELKENLLKAGKSEGCISFNDLNELLPEEIKDPNAIESIFNFLGAHDIEIVTIEESGEKRTLSGEIWEKKDETSLDIDEMKDEMVGSGSEEDVHEAEETTTIDLRDKSALADAMVVTTGNSPRPVSTRGSPSTPRGSRTSCPSIW